MPVTNKSGPSTTVILQNVLFSIVCFLARALITLKGDRSRKVLSFLSITLQAATHSEIR